MPRAPLPLSRNAFLQTKAQTTLNPVLEDIEFIIALYITMVLEITFYSFYNAFKLKKVKYSFK